MSRSAQLDGRRALITGAATGIGKAIAAALTMSGARAALSDIDGPGAIAAAKEIGGGAIGVQHDVGDVARTERVFDEVDRATRGSRHRMRQRWHLEYQPDHRADREELG